jgi:exosortase A-associated hydrolase 2
MAVAERDFPEPMFLPMPGRGERFCLFHAPRALPWRGLVLYVHPFAEEMNKSRRMAALQSRRMAAAGWAVLQMDLLGCGDSSGAFADATWSHWTDDCQFACDWLLSHHRRFAAAAAPPLWLWGLRGGCMLTRDVLARWQGAANLLWWQPVLSGSQALQQFLRLRVAAAMAAGRPHNNISKELMTSLTANQSVEIAGYVLGPQMAGELRLATLAPVAGALSMAPSRIVWLDCAPAPAAEPNPSAVRIAQAWRDVGSAVQVSTVVGPQFWQTAEVEEAPSLLEYTAIALEASLWDHGA